MFAIFGFCHVDELLDNTGWLTVGVHEERTVYRVGSVFDRLDVRFNTVNKNGFDRVVNKTEADITDSTGCC